MKADTQPTAAVLMFPPMPRKVTFTATNRLRELREARGLKLRQVAESLGTTPTHVQRLEIGTRDITFEWMLRLARILEVVPADLFLPDEGGLDAAERDVIDTMREIPAANRAAILSFVASQHPWRGRPEVAAIA